MPTAETEHLVRHLFAGDDGAAMAQRIDRRIHRLPGLDGLGLIDSVRLSVLGVDTGSVRPSELAPNESPRHLAAVG